MISVGLACTPLVFMPFKKLLQILSGHRSAHAAAKFTLNSCLSVCFNKGNLPSAIKSVCKEDYPLVSFPLFNSMADYQPKKKHACMHICLDI